MKTVGFTKACVGQYQTKFLHLGLLIALEVWGFIATTPAIAQIVEDNTLGNENSVVTSVENIRGSPAELIQGGATRGANLFHSFQEFNVKNAQRVYFANPNGIENIFSRITGKNVSNIRGTLGVNGEANLFLLNPNGIVFGQNARLDVAGSFVGSTAKSFVFSDGSEFSTTNPQAPPLLKINLTPGLQFGQNPIGDIVNQGNLVVGKDLTLNGNNLNLQGQIQTGRDLNLQAQNTLRIRDSAVIPFIASSGGKMLIQGNQVIDIFALNHPHSGLFSSGDMVLISANPVGGDAHFWSGGSFQIKQLNENLGNFWSSHDPIIRVNANVSFDTYTGASLHILAGGSVNLSSVIINGKDTSNLINETVTLSDGMTTVAINGSSQPTLDIRAGTTAIGSPLGLAGSSTFTGLNFTSNTTPTADITISSVRVTQPDGLVLLTNQYQPNTAISGAIQVKSILTDDTSGGFSGNGGDVFIHSRGDISFNSLGRIRTFSATGDAGDIYLIANQAISLANGASIRVGTNGPGKSGDINIRGRTLLLTNGAAITTNTFGSGRGGNFDITTSESVQLNGTSFLQAATVGAGDAGNLKINTGELIVRDGSQISTGTFGDKLGGNLTIIASKLVELSGKSPNGQVIGGLFADTQGNGDGGYINVETKNLIVQDGAQISLTTFGSGNGGDLTVIATESVDLRFQPANSEFGTGLFTQSRGGGNAGNLTIDTQKLIIQDGASVSSSAYSKNPYIGIAVADFQSHAGKITVRANDSVEVSGTTGKWRSNIDSETDSSENAGGVTILTGKLTIRDGAYVSTGTYGQGQGGDLTIHASDSVEVTGIDGQYETGLTSEVGKFGTGNGGNLTIQTQKFVARNGGNAQTTNFGEGHAGNLSVNASESVELIGTKINEEGIYVSSSLSTSTLDGSQSGGDLTITTQRLLIQDGGKASASTYAQGNAGSVKINASNGISLDGVAREGDPSGVFSSVSPDSAGNGGSIDMTTPLLWVNHAAGIGVNSEGTGQAGDIQLQADSLTLNNQAFISAETVSNQGGNINIDLNRLLLMRNHSRISTTAGNDQFGGNGGNITINSPFIVAIPKENSDISANAFTGNGGQVNITTNGIFGIQRRESPTDKSDITASSTFGVSGIVTINTPDTDPSRGLTELPSDIVDASGLINQDFCVRGGGSKFTIIGKGGMTPSPNEPQSADLPWDDLRLLTNSQYRSRKPSTQSTTPTKPAPAASIPESIVEAQGLLLARNGKVVLTASPMKVTPQGVWLHPFDCQMLRDGS